MNAKKVFAVVAVVMLVFCFVGTPAFAAGQEKEGASTGKTYESGAYKGTQPQTSETQVQPSRMQSQGMAQLASEMIGRSVRNEQGEQLGEVEDIVISGGQVQYILLSHGGILGIGEKLIPIPYRSARMDTAQNVVVLQNVDKQMLEKAPNFDKKDWKNVGGAEWDRKVYSYYGQEPVQQPGLGSQEYKSREMKGTGQEMRQDKTDREGQMKDQPEQKTR